MKSTENALFLVLQLVLQIKLLFVTLCFTVKGGICVTFDEVKYKLESVLNTDNLIDVKLAEVNELRRRLTDVKSPSFGDRVQATKDPDKITLVIGKIIELENEINADIDKLIDDKKTCRELIERLQSNVYKVILYRIYFEGKTLKTLANSLKMSVRQVARIRNKAIVQIAEISKCP